MKKEFKCFPISEGKAEGEILISEDAINFYIVKPETGILFEEGHSLENVSIAGKILVFPTDKGSSVVQMDSLYQMSKYGKTPKAFIIKRPSTVLVSAAIVMDIPLVSEADEEFYKNIKNGTVVSIDTDKEKIEILNMQ